MKDNIIRNDKDGEEKAFDVRTGGDSDNLQVQIYTKHGRTNQKWYTVNVEDVETSPYFRPSVDQIINTGLKLIHEVDLAETPFT